MSGQDVSWIADTDVVWDDLPEDPARNMERDATLGQMVAEGDRPPTIRLWRSGIAPGIAVSARDVAGPRGEAARQALLREGIDVVVRQTGGTAVPQGEGVLHVSWLWPRTRVSVSIDAAYQLLCHPLVGWLQALGVEATIGPLPGSYCDGRHNVLASGRKLAGTAQAWRGGLAGVASARPGYVLAHACLMVDVDFAQATAWINHFYEEAGDAYRVDPGTSVDLRHLLPRRFTNMSARDANVDSLESLRDFLMRWTQRDPRWRGQPMQATREESL